MLLRQFDKSHLTSDQEPDQTILGEDDTEQYKVGKADCQDRNLAYSMPQISHLRWIKQ